MFSEVSHDFKFEPARNGGWFLSTASPIKTTFSSGKLTQIEPADGPAWRSRTTGISLQCRVISFPKEISGGAQRTLPNPAIDSQSEPVSSPCALKVPGRLRNVYAAFS